MRTFSAPRLHLALAQVREAFGPDAIILDKKQATDENGETEWLVQAAVDPQPSPSGRVSASSGNETKASDSSVNQQLESSMHQLERLIHGLNRKESDALRTHLNNDRERDIFDTLTAQGIAPHFSAELAVPMAANQGAKAPFLSWGRPLRPDAQREVVVVSGPSGAGKTTMIANLATHFSLKGIETVLISTDTERMAGLETLSAYTSILGMPLYALRKTGDAKEIADKCKSARLLLIDTEGWSPANRKAWRRQQPLWQALEPNRHMLLLPANMDEADGMALLEASSGTGITDLLAGKLDETSSVGKVVNWAATAKLPLSYCNFGPAVPDQMGWLNAGTLAALLGRQTTKEAA